MLLITENVINALLRVYNYANVWHINQHTSNILHRVNVLHIRQKNLCWLGTFAYLQITLMSIYTYMYSVCVNNIQCRHLHTVLCNRYNNHRNDNNNDNRKISVCYICTCKNCQTSWLWYTEHISLKWQTQVTAQWNCFFLGCLLPHPYNAVDFWSNGYMAYPLITVWTALEMCTGRKFSARPDP